MTATTGEVSGRAVTRRFMIGGTICLTACKPAVVTRRDQSPQKSSVPAKPSSLLRVRGGRPPFNLNQVVERQAVISKQVFADLRRYMWLPRATGIPPRRFDWRDKGKVTPAKDQGSCGDCWAFAATGAYESAYLIANDQSAPFSLSDQEGLDCAIAPISQLYGCDGGWHDGVFRYIVEKGEVATLDYRPPAYRAEKGVCEDIPTREFHANTYGFVNGATIPTNIQLKQAIAAYGPLAVGVSADGWDANDGNVYYYAKTTPSWKTRYPNGVFVGSPSTEGLTMSNGAAAGIDHDVLLVGWDDNLLGKNGKSGAWIVKNSWSRDWGDDGFIYVAYGTCNIGFNAAWVNVRNVTVPVPNAVSSTLVQISESANKSLNLQR